MSEKECQLVLYKDNEYVGIDFFYSIPEALVAVNEDKEWIDAFSIYPIFPKREGDMIMGSIENQEIVIDSINGIKDHKIVMSDI